MTALLQFPFCAARRRLLSGISLEAGEKRLYGEKVLPRFLARFWLRFSFSVFCATFFWSFLGFS